MRFFYRVVRITHRPAAEDIITVVKEVRENDLQLARILAYRRYLEELEDLRGKYSPTGFSSYDMRKGIGFNCQLLFIDNEDEEIYVVESSMQSTGTAVLAQQQEEKEIFRNLGMDFPLFEF